MGVFNFFRYCQTLRYCQTFLQSSCGNLHLYPPCMRPRDSHSHHPNPHPLIDRLFTLCQVGGCEVVSRPFHLHLSHDQWGWTSFHIFGHLGFLFCELSVHILDPFWRQFQPTSARSQSKLRSWHFSVLGLAGLSLEHAQLVTLLLALVCLWAENQALPINLSSTFSYLTFHCFPLHTWIPAQQSHLAVSRLPVHTIPSI